MRELSKIVLLITVFGLNHSLVAQNTLTAKQIIKKSDDLMRGVKTTKAEMTIKTIRPKWSREMRMKSWSKGQKLSMMLVTSPAKEKGTVFLMKEKEVWNWIPSVERTIKLPPSMMMQSWMGTDFTNDDLVKQSSVVDDYTHKIIGEEVIEGRNCYKIEMIPNEDAAVVWGKIHTWVDKKDFLQLKVEFYDEDGDLVNVMNASNIKKMGGRLVPAKLEVIPVDKKGQKTVMEYLSLEFDTPLNEGFFTIQNMKKVK